MRFHGKWHDSLLPWKHGGSYLGDFRESDIQTISWKLPHFHGSEGCFQRSLVEARTTISPTSFHKASTELMITSVEATVTAMKVATVSMDAIFTSIEATWK